MMIKHLNKLFLLGIIPFMMAGCPKLPNRPEFWVTNQSNRDIFLMERFEQKGGPCPDTTFQKEKMGIIIPAGGFHLDDYSGLTCDTLRMFIISKDTLDKYEWDELRDSYNILVRYDLNINQLGDIGWEVIYPPSDAMRRNLKMYFPPRTK